MRRKIAFMPASLRLQGACVVDRPDYAPLRGTHGGLADQWPAKSPDGVTEEPEIPFP